MFFADYVKSTPRGVFYIANNGVYPFKLRHFNTFRTPAGYESNMIMVALLKSSEAFKTIGHHISLWSQMLLHPSFDRFFGKCTHLAKSNCDWMTLDIYGYCRDERDFSCSASFSFAVMLFAAPVGIVCLDLFTVERFAVATLFHNLLHFMLNQQGCVI